jgi:alpha-ketoglutarate-dependent taurine dioxygenase
MSAAHAGFGDSARIVSDAVKRSLREVVHWSPGKLVIIDNWRLLHARAEPSPGEESERRVLERVLIREAR